VFIVRHGFFETANLTVLTIGADSKEATEACDLVDKIEAEVNFIMHQN
jgi:hypothetical protein